ncbi:hypothetical protein AMAG_20041 [Allomyces macrogynus ATCC 38327]|uniref:Uncharacterized protein n=1 Tax=Allomyces macrogynus (strain ATCC 38327) TaxID=578462 RepID=A0A0L0T4Z0_ALLM3|nr:hypothetical protein AMAG_20041 [Allomyces macrogynus ATCC 38327]|eukprot:KNE69776.1 hypothetical protein AMAG_20041 [Allomyces macrogynus ATCC 38327]
MASTAAPSAAHRALLFSASSTARALRSALTSTSSSTRSATAIPLRALHASGAHASPVGSHMYDNDNAALDSVLKDETKTKVVAGRTDGPEKVGPAEWEQALASDSEAIVKADRAGDAQSVDEMVAETVEALHGDQPTA